MKVVSVLLEREFDRGAGGVCGAGQRLADSLEVPFEVVVSDSLPPAALEAVASLADRVVVLEGIDRESNAPEGILNQLEAHLKESEVKAIVFGSGVYAQELTPRLAYRLGGSGAGDVQTLEVFDGSVRVTRAVYGGKAMAVLSLRQSPAVVWVRSAGMEPASARDVSGEVSRGEAASSGDVKAALVERHRESVEGVRLEDAPVIVSGGRGLGGAAAFERLKALAAPLNAEMAASRAACDLGWVPHSWQVGQTGKKVAPELYLAIAMSGSSQHLMGIADARTIAAINIDPEAPIFKHSRFGIVEDYDRVVDRLRDRLAEKLK